MKQFLILLLLGVAFPLTGQVTDAFQELSDRYRTEFWGHWNNQEYDAAQAFLLRMHTAYYSLPREGKNLHRSEMANVCYNLACAYSIKGQTQEGLAALKEAIQFGWKDQAWTLEDSDLENLRQDPGFKDVFRRMTRRAPYIKLI